VSEFARFYIDD
jgi:hypothetical protein